MVSYTIRRFVFAIPLLLIISLIMFWILSLAEGDPAGNLPLTIPAEVREAYRDALGLNDGFWGRWTAWVKAMFWIEPQAAFESVTDVCIGECVSDGDRIISFSSRAPVVPTIYERIPQTVWVLGLALLFGVMLAVPIGIYSAYRQYSVFDNVGTFVSIVGWAMPVYWTGTILIHFFSVKLGWLPSFYRTEHDVSLTDWDSIWFQFKQIVMPVTVLTLFNAAAISRFTRASVLENLSLDYVRTARSKGLGEFLVVNRHVLRNSMIPVVTLIALSAAGIFSGAILTESVFKINGLGQYLLTSIRQSDTPAVQTVTFFFAVMTVFFNIVADVLYGLLDPRIRYE